MLFSISYLAWWSTYSLGVVKDLELGGILDVVDLGPVDGNGSTGLDMR